MENLHVKIEQIEGDTLTIRQGKALELLPPRSINIAGDIKTVSSFIKKRKTAGSAAGLQQIDKDKALVVVDKEKKTIVLSLDPQDAYGAVITAKMEPNPDLEKFGINKNVQFSQKELVNLLKFSRLYFEDFGTHGTLLKAYQVFSAKTYTDLSGDSDNRGNKNFAFNKKVETGLPTSFIMNLPIFKGQKPKRFMVEICLDVTDAAASFWFESIELAELSELEGAQILDEELESCADYVIIWK
jgi:hypothetical protein